MLEYYFVVSALMDIDSDFQAPASEIWIKFVIVESLTDHP